MAGLVSIPIPYQVLQIRKNVEAAVVAAWDEDQATKASGALGVVTRERSYPQLDGLQHRDYGAYQLPALWCSARLASFQESEEMSCFQIDITIQVGALAENATAQTALDKCLDVQEVGATALVVDVRGKRSSWLASVPEVGEVWATGWQATAGPVFYEERAQSAHRFTSVTEVPIALLWTPDIGMTG